jgi:RNA polymerase sigma factor (sigma-70 family)
VTPIPDHPEALLRETAWLRALARTLLQDPHLADDAVQDTCMAALTSGPRSADSRRPWLATVLRNFALRAQLRRSNRAARERACARAEALPSAADLVERISAQRGVVDAVLALDEPLRRTILLRYFEDLPPRVIARELGVPVNTVRTRLQRGLLILRARLDREHGSRAAWAALLVPRPAAPVAAVATSVAGVVSGVLFMSTAHKLALAGVAIVVAATAFAVWQPWVPVAAEPGARDALAAGGVAADPAAASVPTSAPAAATESRRVAVAAARAADAPPMVTLVGQLVEEQSSQPVVGAQVTLAHRFARSRDELHAVSDAAGRFAVELPKENSARHSLPGDILVEATDLAPFHQPLPRQEILQATGDRFDLGILRLPRGARVSGRVVRESDGVAVAGARVLWTDVNPQNEMFLPSYARDAGLSGADGSFTLRERLPPMRRGMGEHTLFAVSDQGLGWARLGIPSDCEQTEVTIQVPPTGVARVQVTDHEGKPIAGARVQAVPLFAPVGPSQPWHQKEDLWIGRDAGIVALLVATTDRDGSAVLPQLAGGTYLLSATQQRHHPARKRGVAVRPGRETVVELTLQPLVEVTVQGRVVDRGRRAIADAVVQSGERAPAARTGADGRFAFGPVSVAGDLHLQVTAEGYGEKTTTIDLGKHDADTPVEIVLARVQSITGRILDQDGNPVAGANPFVQRGGRIAGRGGAPKTGEDGAFVLPVAAHADEVELIAMPPGPHGRWQPGEPVVVRPGDGPVELRLRRPAVGHATLTVQVTAADGATPVEPTSAALLPKREAWASTTFAIATQIERGLVTARELAAGDYELHLQAPGGRARTPVHIGAEDRDVRLRVAIARPGRLVGQVVFDDVPAALRTGQLFFLVSPHEARQLGADGKPVAGQIGSGVFLDAGGDGRFVLGEVLPGSLVQVKLIQHETLTGAASITMPANGEATIEVRVRVGGKVRFVTDTPLPVGSYQVEVAGEDGSFELAHSARLEQAAPLRADVVLPPGPLRWRLSGRTTARPGEPARTAAVEGTATVGRGQAQRVTIDWPR